MVPTCEAQFLEHHYSILRFIFQLLHSSSSSSCATVAHLVLLRSPCRITLRSTTAVCSAEDATVLLFQLSAYVKSDHALAGCLMRTAYPRGYHMIQASSFEISILADRRDPAGHAAGNRLSIAECSNNFRPVRHFVSFRRPYPDRLPYNHFHSTDSNPSTW